jgi:hypothetical protein
MIDERNLLLKALETMPIAAVHGPDKFNRVQVEFDGEGYLDLGKSGTPSADAALEWRSRRVIEWLDKYSQPKLAVGG